MPLKRCQTDGQPGWKWGDGKCYPYTAGNEASETAARKKALAQAAAMGEFPGTGQREDRQADRGNITTPDAGDLNTDARRYCAQRGWAMPDGSYPIRPLDMHGRTDLTKAIRAVGRGGGSHEAIRRHIIKRARALGLSDMIPENWSGGGGSRSSDETSYGAVVEHRSATLQDVDTRKRLVDVVMVPYDQEADIHWQNDVWHESHDRHAYDGIEDHAGRIQVNREHVKGRTVGKIVAADPAYPSGLFGRAFIYPTELGDETLTLAEHGGAFPSVGFRVHRPSDMRIDKRTRTRKILRAFLDHLAFVEDPAFPTEVLAVRAGQSGLAVARPLPETPALDEALNDPMFEWVSQRLNHQ